MSQENVDTVRESVQAFADGDMERLATYYTPNSRIAVPEGWPETGPFEGREAVIQHAEQAAAWRSRR